MSLTEDHLGAFWSLCGFSSQPSGQHLRWQGQQAVTGQIQVGEVLDVNRGLCGQRGELVVVQIEESEAGHIHERLPGKGSESVPIQTELFQVEQPPETVGAQSRERVEGHPQEFQTGEVDEGFAWNLLDGRLLDAQLGCVNWEPDRHKRNVGVVAYYAPKKGKVHPQGLFES